MEEKEPVARRKEADIQVEQLIAIGAANQSAH